MLLKKYIFLGLLPFFYNVIQVFSKFELTNINCTVLDKSFCGFEYCYIKSINRTYKYYSVKVNLYKIPVTKVKVNFSLMKRFSGYKPFLYNITFDMCKFLATKNKNPVANYFFTGFEPFSNINHTCPYGHDIIVDKLPVSAINNHLTNVLPFPSGDYALFTSWYAYGIHRADIKVYGTLSEF